MKDPLDGHEIEKYVAADTLQKQLKVLAQEIRTGDALMDEDPFIKANGWDDEWPANITATFARQGPGDCTTVHVALGKDKGYLLAACMVKEDGTWKVRSVTQLSGE